MMSPQGTSHFLKASMRSGHVILQDLSYLFGYIYLIEYHYLITSSLECRCVWVLYV